MKKFIAVTAAFVAIGLNCAVLGYAQSMSAGSGTVRGVVLDPSGAAVKAAAVVIQNPVSQYIRDAKTDDQGKFEFDNVPYNNYHASVAAPGFGGSEQDLSVRSPVPVDVKFTLQIGTEKT